MSPNRASANPAMQSTLEGRARIFAYQIRKILFTPGTRGARYGLWFSAAT